LFHTGLLQAEAYIYSDIRRRSKSDDPDYTPPPPIPTIRLEMIEEDLMEYVAELVGQNVVVQKRQTTADNSVYRITIQAREKTEVLLRVILPYIVGEKNRSNILGLLNICDTYNKWVAEGGALKSNHGRLAQKAKARTSKDKAKQQE
jgi:hypothetical protein